MQFKSRNKTQSIVVVTLHPFPVCSQVIAYAKKELSVNVDKVPSGHETSARRNSEALQLCLLHPAKVLLDKIWRCTVDEDEKGISFEKPVPYCLSPDAKT